MNLLLVAFLALFSFALVALLLIMSAQPSAHGETDWYNPDARRRLK